MVPHILLIVLLAATGHGRESQQPTTVDFLEDVLQSDALRVASRRVNAFTCWSLELNKVMWERFSRVGVIASVSTQWQHRMDLNAATLSDEALLFIVDVTCKSSEKLLVQAGNENLFSFPHRWILIDHQAEIPEHRGHDTTATLYEARGTPVKADPSLADHVADTITAQDVVSGSGATLYEARGTPLKADPSLVDNVADAITAQDVVSGSGATLYEGKGTPLKADPSLADNVADAMTVQDVVSCLPSENTSIAETENIPFQSYVQYLNSNEKYSHNNNSLLNLLPIFVDSQVLIGKYTPGVGFILAEVFKRGPLEALVSQVIGVWNVKTGLQLSQYMSQPVAIRRLNLMGTKITAAIVVTDNDTLTRLTGLGNKHIDTITKLNYALFVHLIELMNASMEIIHTDSWGYASNGSWNGMAGYLQRGEADVGATALFFTKDRMAVMEYIAMTSPAKICFVFRQPPLSYVSNVFALPFSKSVWTASAILVALTGVLLYGALRWEAKRDMTSLDLEIEQHLGAKLIGRTTWSDVVLLSLGAVCQQGSTVEPRSVPGRLVTLILFIAVIFLYTSYSASIVALLQSSTDSINTLHDLLHSRLDLGVHDIVYNHHYFKVSTDPIRKAIYRQKVAPPGKKPRFFSLEEGVRRVRKGLFAFHMQTSPGYQLISETFREDEKCGLKEITFLQVVDPHVAIQRNSPYREMFKIGYRKILERGLQSRAVRRYNTVKPECTTHGSSFVSVGIIDFYPALLVLAYGSLCAGVVLVLEMLVYKRKSTCCPIRRHVY